MGPDDAMRELIGNCPEILGILPPEVTQRESWARFLCSFDEGFRGQFDTRINSTFDFACCAEWAGAHESGLVSTG